MKANWLRFTHNGTGGSGTLTLAHVTGYPDPYQVWGGTQPPGFTTTVPVQYEILEFTDATLTTLLQAESGRGRLSIGANIGATTLIRDTPIASWVDGSPGVYTPQSASAITAGATAANVVIIVGQASEGTADFNPYFEASLGDAIGVSFGLSVSGQAPPASGDDWYVPFRVDVPLLVKRATIRVVAADAGTSNAYFRIYEFGTNGRPGRLLIDLGLLGTSGQSLKNIGAVSTALATNGLWLTPGDYWADLYTTYANSPTVGKSGTVAAAANQGPQNRAGISGGSPFSSTLATGGSSTGPDPANLTGYALASGSNVIYGFALNNA